EGKRLLVSQSIPNPNPSFVGFNYVNNAASSRYNAFQLQDQGFVAPGLQLVASYVWAHALDDASTDTVASSPSALDPGNSDYDIRHSFNFAMNYRTPGRGARLLRAIVGGWMVANRFTATTGYPFNPIATYTFNALGGLEYFRPD